METNFVIFMSFIALSMFLISIGFIRSLKMPFLIMIGGALIAFWGIMTDTLIMDREIKSIDTSTTLITVTYIDHTVAFEGWTKILFGLTGGIINIAGAVIWKQQEQ